MTGKIGLRGTPMEEVRKEHDDEAAAIVPVTDETFEAAFNVIGDELVRREVLARRAGDTALAERLMAGLTTLNFAGLSLKESVLLNDFLRYAVDLREELAALPEPDPDDDDAWIQRE
ncbi:MAG: hypothetical protein JXB47_20775 [Anaerolineae bacterium]|nr:hypothetical protein [Anaerolineae bacterium]